MKPYVVLEKNIGETPLKCVEKWRQTEPAMAGVPLAYAGRLDPMASGALLVLIGDECKRQTAYHSLDKTYVVDILFGVATDSGDVLGIPHTTKPAAVTPAALQTVLHELQGPVSLPYPAYSSKTVKGKPLHTWTLEGRLDEITIPTKTSTIYKTSLGSITSIAGSKVFEYISHKIETIQPVTDSHKALGNDFRRPDIRAAWQTWCSNYEAEMFTQATITCTASSGTYMRTLAEVIGDSLGTPALAYHIHRTELGVYRPLWGSLGIWTTRYRAAPRTF